MSDNQTFTDPFRYGRINKEGTWRSTLNLFEISPKIMKWKLTYPGGHLGWDPEIQGVSIQCLAAKKTIKIRRKWSKNHLGNKCCVFEILKLNLTNIVYFLRSIEMHKRENDKIGRPPT